jgi:hypothetical protein
MLQLIGVLLGLAIEVNSKGKMLSTSRAKGDPYKIAKKNGWTFETGNGTLAARQRCLRDVLAIMIANRDGYEVPSTVAQALGPDMVADAHSLAAQIKAGQ